MDMQQKQTIKYQTVDPEICLLGSGINFSITFILCMIFREKYSMLYFFKFISFLEVLGNMCIVVICFLVYYVINFEINLSNQAVFLHD